MQLSQHLKTVCWFGFAPHCCGTISARMIEFRDYDDAGELILLQLLSENLRRQLVKIFGGTTA
jgi:hypothetical protein